MKPKINYPSLLCKLAMAPLLFVSLVFLLNGCFLKEDRTTVIYGAITDENKQPVDSILVLLSGIRFLGYEDLKTVYSDKEGHYELVIDLPGKFNSVDVGIPALVSENHKFMRAYKIHSFLKNDMASGNCCTASLGQKTRYDFELMPR
jgi:hypothetical protein